MSRPAIQGYHGVLIVTSLFFPSITIMRPFLTSPLSPRIGSLAGFARSRRIDRDTFFHPQAERIARIRMNPDVGRVERNRRAADVHQTAFRERETRPPSELLLADREVVIVPGVEHSGESRRVGGKFNHPAWPRCSPSRRSGRASPAPSRPGSPPARRSRGWVDGSSSP